MGIILRASPSYSKRERVWGIIYIQRVPVKEFPNTIQIAERMTIHHKNVIYILVLHNKNSWLA